MNDRDVEKLVSRLQRPAPSPELDARIAEITRHVSHERPRSRVWKLLRVTSALACAGMIGFLLGRQSISAPPSQAPLAQMGSGLGNAIEPEKPDVRLEVRPNEAFVRLMTKPTTFVSVFGNQPLEKQNSVSKIQ